MYAYDIKDTIEAVAALSSGCDFTTLSETRETSERKATLDHRLLTSQLYFSSFIDQFKCGVAILAKTSFMDKFPNTDKDNCWKVIVPGRVGRLELLGPRGSPHIYAIYLDPQSKSSQKDHIAKINDIIDDRVHNLFAGDFNFVEQENDRLIKQTMRWSIGEYKTVAACWQAFVDKHNIKE